MYLGETTRRSTVFLCQFHDGCFPEENISSSPIDFPSVSLPQSNSPFFSQYRVGSYSPSFTFFFFLIIQTFFYSSQCETPPNFRSYPHPNTTSLPCYLRPYLWQSGESGLAGETATVAVRETTLLLLPIFGVQLRAVVSPLWREMALDSTVQITSESLGTPNRLESTGSDPGTV